MNVADVLTVVLIKLWMEQNKTEDTEYSSSISSVFVGSSKVDSQTSLPPANEPTPSRSRGRRQHTQLYDDTESGVRLRPRTFNKSPSAQFVSHNVSTGSLSAR